MTSGTGRYVKDCLAAAVIALAAVVYGDDPINLLNGVPVTALAGATGSEVNYRIVVPPGQGELNISIGGGTGDCDLYVRKGAPPTYGGFSYRPFLFGNEETVTVDSPAAGNWYIQLRARDSYSGVTLLATYTPATPKMLANGVAVGGVSGSSDTERLYAIDVPAGQISLDIETSDGVGDIDVYVKRGWPPSLFDYDGCSCEDGAQESVHLSYPVTGRWYIMLHASAPYSGVTLRAAYSDTKSAPCASKEMTATGLSGALGSHAVYSFDVSCGLGGIDFATSGGTGDCDMYIKKGAVPTPSDCDFDSTGPGTSESMYVTTDDMAGEWYILLVATEAYSDVTLHVEFIPSDLPPEEPPVEPAPKVTPLAPGIPVTDLAGAAGSEQFFGIEVPAYVKTLRITMSGGAGDADLYVRQGQPPSIQRYDYRPTLQGNTEQATVTQPAPGVWYIMIRGYQAFAGVSLVVTFDDNSTDAATALDNCIPVTNLSGDQGSAAIYKIEVPAGQGVLRIDIFGGTGDADLYVKKGEPPSVQKWDYHPGLHGNDETVEIQDPAAATWYVLVHGYQAFAGVTLQACYKAPAKI